MAELRERVEYLEDSLAAFEARAERDESALRSGLRFVYRTAGTPGTGAPQRS
jgi:hypothetical protein